MRGELDDALARLERWDEVRRQLVHEAGGGESLLDEAIRALTGVLHRRGTGTVTLTVSDAGGTASIEMTIRDGAVQTSTPAESSGGTAPARPSRSAARLAEMIRQNPALLDGLRAGTDQPEQ